MTDIGEFKGHSTQLTTICEMTTDGKWKATQTLLYKRSKDLIEWEEAEISAEVINNNLMAAVKEVSLTLFSGIDSEDDLFNNPTIAEEILQ